MHLHGLIRTNPLYLDRKLLYGLYFDRFTVMKIKDAFTRLRLSAYYVGIEDV
jgi:hypothetical protein